MTVGLLPTLLFPRCSRSVEVVEVVQEIHSMPERDQPKKHQDLSCREVGGLGGAPRPYEVSCRLDADSSGLLLLTDNGRSSLLLLLFSNMLKRSARLADSMLQPSKGKEKEYVVMVH